MLHRSHLPPKFWAFAVQTAAYLINRTPPSNSHSVSPFEILFQKPLNYLKLRTFGCICFPWLRPYNLGKLDFPSKPCIFIGYSTHQSAYKCYDPESGRIYVSRNVKFLEFTFWKFSDSPVDNTQVDAFLHLANVPQSKPTMSRESRSSSISLQPSEPTNTTTTESSRPSSSTQSLPPPTCTHAMRTRAQNNTFKPKRLYSATKHPLPADVEPTCVS